jgi:hypothetical protein
MIPRTTPITDLADWLSNKLSLDQEITATEIRNFIQQYASERDEAIGGSEIFWLVYFGYMTKHPHIWKGKHDA